MSLVLKPLMFLGCFFMSSLWLWSTEARAYTYKEALLAYEDQRYSTAYRMAMDVADSQEGKRKAKSLVIAALSALELNKEDKAKKLYRAALTLDSELEMPEVVRSKRVVKFFDDVKSGKPDQKLKGQIVEVVSKNVSDASDFETYLPFGFNQMIEGKAVTAVALGGAQIAAIYYGITQTQNAEAIDQKLQKKTQDVILSGDYETSQFKDFRTKSQKAAANARQTSIMAYGSAVLAYTASVLEIILNPPMELKVVDSPVPRESSVTWQIEPQESGWSLSLTRKF
jgi:hypothetical protein